MLVFGSGVGLINGLLVTLGGLPPFIATLATLSVLRGVAQIITKGYSIPRPSRQPLYRDRPRLLVRHPLPDRHCRIGFVSWATCYSIVRRFGIYITGIGSSEEAVRRNGVNTQPGKS